MATIQVAGRIARDAETRYSPNGWAFTKFSIAENVYKNKRQEAQFFNCTIFGERGQKLEQYIKKGGAATVFGVLHVEKYNGKDGVERQSNEIMVGDITLQGSKSDSQPNNDSSSSMQQVTQRERGADGEPEDDIPF